LISVEGAVDHRSDHALGIVGEQGLLEHALAGSGFPQHQAQAALLGVNFEDFEDLLLMGQKGQRFGIERIVL